jgi:glycine cleavage system H protein
MAEYPDSLVYSSRHVWAKANKKDNTALIGVTDYVTEEFAEIDSIDLPMKDDELEMDSLVIHIHIRNRIKHLRCPLTGRVLDINREVLDDPRLLYMDWQKNWLFKMEFDDRDELDLLMSGAQYAKYLDSL